MKKGCFYKYNNLTKTHTDTQKQANKHTKKTHNIQVSFLEYLGCMQAIKTYLKSLKTTIDENILAKTPGSSAKIYAQVERN